MLQLVHLSVQHSLGILSLSLLLLNPFKLLIFGLTLCFELIQRLLVFLHGLHDLLDLFVLTRFDSVDLLLRKAVLLALPLAQCLSDRLRNNCLNRVGMLCKLLGPLVLVIGQHLLRLGKLLLQNSLLRS